MIAACAITVYDLDADIVLNPVGDTSDSESINRNLTRCSSLIRVELGFRTWFFDCYGSWVDRSLLGILVTGERQKSPRRCVFRLSSKVFHA